MTMMKPLVPKPVPNDWDRKGLPSWTYHSPEMFALERSEIFLTHWQIAGHVNDIPAPGDWISFDMLGERALIIRGKDNEVRSFHNLCRHRGARLTEGAQGHCRGALVCPFHGWVYNSDGSLRGPARPETFGDMDRKQFGLKTIESEIWMGFIFLRFNPGPQPSVAEWLAPYAADMMGYKAADLLPVGDAQWATTLPVNWKSVRDVDNEGYHVALAHPGLQDLYGRTYIDHVSEEGLAWSTAQFGDAPGRLWSVKQYVAMSPEQPDLPQHLRKAWTYYGIFPNAVIAFTPECAQFYQDIPVNAGETELRGRQYRRPNESRQARVARYLAGRIDRETSAEDRQLSIWSNESMRSSAFEGFHLSDLEYGVRNHHDQLRKLLPQYAMSSPPLQGELAQGQR